MTAWFPIVLAITMLVRLAGGFLELEYGSQAQTIVSEGGALCVLVALAISFCVDVVNGYFFFKKRGN